MIDTSSLFLHVLGAIGIVGGGLAQVLAGFRLRTATTGHEVVAWARYTRSAGLLIAGSAVVALLTGGHLAGAVWTTEARSGFSYPFITLGLLGLVVLAPIGPMIGGARLRRVIERADDAGDARVTGDLLTAVRSPRLWGAVHSLPGVGVGLVALMVYKPGWGRGAVLLLVTFALGWVAGSVLASRARPT